MEQSYQPDSPRFASDWLLEFLNHMANAESGSIEFTITVTLGGALISGRMVSERKFFERVAEHIRSPHFTGIDQDDREEMAKALSEIFAKIPEQRRDDIAAIVEHMPEPLGSAQVEEKIHSQHIHLDNVRVISSRGQMTNFPGAIWRGRLEAIDGFWLGQTEENHPE